MLLLDITPYVGRFHPLLVHLPIGFLVLAVLFDLLARKERYVNLKLSIPFIFLVSFISAVLACILGYFLSQSGDYEASILRNHKYAGIALAVVSLILYLLKKPYFKLSDNTFTFILLGQMALLGYTGHQGGNLTHGADYLSLSNLEEKAKKKPGSLDQALVFEDLVLPILEEKCQQCHQNGKMKGGLRLLNFEDLLKGGKHGAVISPGQAEKSEIFRRVTLDPNHKEYMPTDGKPAMTKAEVALLEWWLGEGKGQKNALFRKIPNSDKFKNTALAILGIGVVPGLYQLKGNKINERINPDIPAKVDPKALDIALAAGFNIRKMHLDPVMLDVSYVNKSEANAVNLDVLKPLAANIIWLNVSDLGLKDNVGETIAQFRNLEKLRIEKNNISDAFIPNITHLKHLNAINLNQTNVSIASIIKLQKMPGLKSIYVWSTKVDVRQVTQDSTRATVIL